jgi:hypothetical protein
MFIIFIKNVLVVKTFAYLFITGGNFSIILCKIVPEYNGKADLCCFFQHITGYLIRFKNNFYFMPVCSILNKKSMLRSVLLAMVSLICFQSIAQQFGGHPASTKWQQLNSDTARVIFKRGNDSLAREVAGLVHALALQQPYSLGNKLKKINIVLQPNTTIANGYVGLGPFRSEFYMTPAVSSFQQGSIPWQKQLAVHEYRHVQQFNNFNNGLSKVAGILFGQEGYALAINASVPDWFYEGDAVYAETFLTKQGRGRLPLFNNMYPALWQAGKDYSWMKLRNGSLKDYVPTHYHLGYLLVNYGRETYGNDIWTKVTRDASAFKGLFYPMQKAVKRHTGKSYKEFYQEAFDFYGKKTTGVTADNFVLPVNKKVVTHYKYPYVLGGDSLLYLQWGYNQREALMLKEGNTKKRLRFLNIRDDDQFNYSNGKVVYAAYENNPRWRWHDYSVIKVLDLATNQQTTIGKKTKYFRPDISADGSKIVATQVAVNGQTALHVLNAADGTIATELQHKDISYYADPRFIDNQTIVFAARYHNGTMALVKVNTGDGLFTPLTPATYKVVGNPYVQNDSIYFTAGYDGSDHAYMLSLANNNLYKIAASSLGNYNLQVNNNKLTWGTFHAEGFNMEQKDLSNVQWLPVDKNQLVADTDADAVILKDQVHQDTVETYKKYKHLLNAHSWRPYYEDPLLTYSLYSENILNTLQSELYYQYNENDRTHATGVNLSYGGWYPQITGGAQYTFNRWAQAQNRRKEWSQLDAGLGFNIPLSWTSGTTFKNFNWGVRYQYRNDFNTGVYKDSFTTVKFSYLIHQLSWSQYIQSAAQHIYPRLGYAINAQYRHAISSYTSWQPVLTGAVYLPGFQKSHSIVVSGAYQETDTTYALFGNRMPYSRGYEAPYFARMWRVGTNYHFPILYPDWGFGNILYLQRIRGNVFYDITRVYNKIKQPLAWQRSTGAEVFIDTKWWNQHPLTFGFRTSYLLDTDFYYPNRKLVFEFIMPVSILPR